MLKLKFCIIKLKCLKFYMFCVIDCAFTEESLTYANREALLTNQLELLPNLTSGMKGLLTNTIKPR